MSGSAEGQVMGIADRIGSRPRAMRVNEVATLLNVSERQVYKLAAESRIPAFRIGGSLRFDPFVLATWLRNKMPPGELTHMEENPLLGRSRF